MKHSHKWIASLMQSLEAECKPEVREKILEGCGRGCIPRSFLLKAKKAREKSKSTKEFLENLGKKWNHLHVDKEGIYVVYEKCYCPLVKDYPEKLSKTWCNCSRGWAKQLFESALGKPVEVTLEKSIKNGDTQCKFRVTL